VDALSELRVLALDEHHCAAAWRRLYVQCWDETRAAAVDDNIRLFRAELAKGAGPTASLVILEPDAPPPDREARRKLDELAAILTPDCACLAYVYQGEGFRAAAIRGVMVALSLVSRRRVVTKIASTVDEALAEMDLHLGDARYFGEARHRVAVVDEIRRRFRARPR
jgi:hypothetical protein